MLTRSRASYSRLGHTGVDTLQRFYHAMRVRYLERCIRLFHGTPVRNDRDGRQHCQRNRDAAARKFLLYDVTPRLLP